MKACEAKYLEEVKDAITVADEASFYVADIERNRGKAILIKREYDKDGKILKAIYPDFNKEYTYDKDGKLLFVIKFDIFKNCIKHKVTEEFNQYDQLGRLVEQTTTNNHCSYQYNQDNTTTKNNVSLLMSESTVIQIDAEGKDIYYKKTTPNIIRQTNITKIKIEDNCTKSVADETITDTTTGEIISQIKRASIIIKDGDVESYILYDKDGVSEFSREDIEYKNGIISSDIHYQKGAIRSKYTAKFRNNGTILSSTKLFSNNNVIETDYDELGRIKKEIITEDDQKSCICYGYDNNGNMNYYDDNEETTTWILADKNREIYFENFVKSDDSIVNFITGYDDQDNVNYRMSDRDEISVKFSDDKTESITTILVGDLKDMLDFKANMIRLNKRNNDK